MSYHYCAVPDCMNTGVKTPGKLWLQVPTEINMRRTWFALARRDTKLLSEKSRMYFCEDHFDLENDMENYMEYKIMGSVKRIRLKPHCVPSRFSWNSQHKSAESAPIQSEESSKASLPYIEVIVVRRAVAAPVSSAAFSPAIKTESCEDPVYDKFNNIEVERIDWKGVHQVEVEFERSEIPSTAPAMAVSRAMAAPVLDAASSPTIKTEPCEEPVNDESHDINLEEIKSEQEVQSLLYVDHEIKEEMVIGPTEIQRPAPATLHSTTHSTQAEERGEPSHGVRSHPTRPSPAPPHTKPYSCDHCGKQFRMKRYLITHMRVHNVDKPFSCDHCRRRYRWKCDLLRHLHVHSSENPFSCNQCNEQFTSNKGLTQHLLVHNEPFSCDQCEKQFRLKTEFDKHIRVHRSNKPFACYECEKRFVRKIGLVRHLRVHSGETPFCCDQCDQRFTCKSYLVKHQRVHSHA